jgi:biotin carboxylase
MSDKTILILGGGVMQLPAIKSAIDMGWKIIVADGNSNVPGRDYADYFENIDLKNTEKMIQAALSYKGSIGLDGVFTAGTDFSETVARVASAAGLPGISIEASINASNKSKMREAFRAHNISSPLFVSVNTPFLEDCTELEDRGLQFPLVVKPVDNMGSRGIRRTDNCAELRKAMVDAFKFSRSATVIIEEYLEGSEYSIDALIYKNEITICGFADRHIFYPPYFIEMGHTIPSAIETESDLYKKIISTFKAAVRALGITEGAAKGDVRYSRGKIYIGEIAARLSGGYMSGWTYPYSSGVLLTREALKIAVGQPPGNLQPSISRITVERAFISIPGIITEITGIKNAKEDTDLKEIFLRVTTGADVKFPENNVEKVGNCIAVHKKRSVAEKSALLCCQKIFVRLEACNTQTEEFLFGNLQSWVEDAFSISEPANIAAFKKMADTEIYSMDKIAVLALPSLELENCTEWHGISIENAFQEVLAKKYQIKNIGVSNSDSSKEGIVLGRWFYLAFLRGGVQGGVWIIDSILKTVKEKKNIMELLTRWKKY